LPNKRSLITNDDPYAVDETLVAADKSRSSDWKPEKEANRVRILPLKGTGRYYRKIYIHYNLGPNNRRAICPEKLEEGKCVVCARERMLSRSPREAHKQEAKAIYAKARYLVALVDLEAPDKGVQTYPLPQQVFTSIEGIRQEPGMPNPFHPEKGRGFTIRKISTGSDRRNVQYQVTPAANPTPLERMEWVDEALAIVNDYVRFEDPDRLTAWMESGLPDEERSAPQQDRVAAPVSPAAPKKRTLTPPSDDDEDDDAATPSSAADSALAGLRKRITEKVSGVRLADADDEDDD